MRQDSIDVSLVIVNWNTESLLGACLEAIHAHSQDVQFETWVIDNHSRDTSVAMVHQNFPGVRLITNAVNRGFAGACNQGLRSVSGRYVMLLNPDTEVRPEAFAKLVEFLDEHPEAGGAGPKLLYPDGRVQQIGFYRKTPTLFQVVLFYTPLRWMAKQSRWLKERYWEHQDHEHVCEVDQPPGAALMVRREVVDQIGGLDERFFLYFEDVDWCLRMRRAGWRLFFLPSAEIIHHVGGTTAQLGTTPRRYLLAKSMIRFFRKHHGWLMAFFVAGIVALGAVIEYFLAIFALPFMIAARGKQHTCFSGLWRLISGNWRQQLHPLSTASTPLHPEAIRST